MPIARPRSRGQLRASGSRAVFIGAPLATTCCRMRKRKRRSKIRVRVEHVFGAQETDAPFPDARADRRRMRVESAGINLAGGRECCRQGSARGAFARPIARTIRPTDVVCARADPVAYTTDAWKWIAVSRQRYRNLYSSTSSMPSTTVCAVNPCRKAFRRERSFPATVRGQYRVADWPRSRFFGPRQRRIQSTAKSG